MTGDGQPDIAIGAPLADYNGVDSGSVWIISAHLPPSSAAPRRRPRACVPWIRLRQLTAGQGYRIDGAAAGDQLGTSLAGIGDQTGDGIRDLAIGSAAASPNGRAGSGQVVIVPGQAHQTTRNLAVTPPVQTIYGPVAGAGLGASLATAGVVDGSMTVLAGAPGEASAAGAAYLVRIAPGTTSDLALAPSKIAPAGAGAMTGSNVAAGSALDGAGADTLVAAPGANGGGAWYLVGGSGTPVLPPPPGSPAPPAPPPVPPAPPAPPAAPPAPPAHPPAPPADTGGGTRHDEDSDGHRDRHDDRDDDDEGRRQAGRQEEKEEASALPAQEAEDEVQDRQGQAREGETGALPPAPDRRDLPLDPPPATDCRAGLPDRRRRGRRRARFLDRERRRPERRRPARPRDRRVLRVPLRALGRRARSSSCPGRADPRRATSPSRRRSSCIAGSMAGAGLGASLAAAGDMDGDGRIDLLAGAPGELDRAGAAYLLRGAPGTTTDLALATRQDRRRRRRRAVRQRGGRRAGARRRRRRRPDRRARRGRRVHRQRRRACSIRRRPSCPPLPAPAPPARAVAAPATAATKPAATKPKKLKLCPLKKPKAKYKVVNGKRVKVKPAPCRARAQGEVGRRRARRPGNARLHARVARSAASSRLESAACPRTPTTARPIPPSATRRS